jgi:hypothetical protein
MPNPILDFDGWPVPPLVAPRNAPPDDLDAYLALWRSQARAFVQGQEGPNHAEWDVNTRLPRMRNLRGLSAFFGVGDILGPDTTLTFPSTGVAQVSATWAQRAINASYASLDRPTRVAVDGIAGPQTLNALKDLRLRFLAMIPPPIPTSPRVVSMPTIVDRGHVTLPGDLYQEMTTLIQVADPTRQQADATPPPSPPAASSSGGGGLVFAAMLGVGFALLGRR